MGYTSSVVGDKVEGVSLHKYPLHDRELLEKWVHRSYRQDNFKPGENSGLCFATFFDGRFHHRIHRQTDQTSKQTDTYFKTQIYITADAISIPCRANEEIDGYKRKIKELSVPQVAVVNKLTIYEWNNETTSSLKPILWAATKNSLKILIKNVSLQDFSATNFNILFMKPSHRLLFILLSSWVKVWVSTYTVTMT